MDIKKVILYIFLLNINLTIMANDYYYMELQDDGTPFFTQIISWKEVPAASTYELIVISDDNVEIYHQKSRNIKREVNLTPGKYKYSIIVYNLLDKPELQTQWVSIEILKATKPRIEKISPDKLYFENQDFQLKLWVEDIDIESEFWLINSTTQKPIGKIEDISIINDKKVLLKIPEKMRNRGSYNIKAINPGGIEAVSPSLTLGYYKETNLTLSVGYNPLIPIYDSYFTSYWNDGFYPLGGVVRLDMILFKDSKFNLGGEFVANLLSYDTKVETTTIESNYYSGGINLIYKRILSLKYQLLFRLGGGIQYSSYTMNYNGVIGSDITSYDPYIATGISAQYYMTHNIFLESGIDFKQCFYSEFTMGGIYPFLSVGFSH